MPVFNHNAIELYYEIHGNGPPLIMLAGLASDSASWLSLLPKLTSHYTVLILDNRGVGRSIGDCEISIKLMADDCAALICHLGLKKVRLIGHSMGGMTALELSLCYPELIESIVLVATAARNTARNNLLFADWSDWYESTLNRKAWYRSVFTWIFTERFFENPQIVDDYVAYQLDYPWQQSARSFKNQVKAIKEYNSESRLFQVRVNTCVIAGRQDILLPVHCSIKLAEQIPGAMLKIIEGAAHSVHTEQPDIFSLNVIDFFEERSEVTT